MMMNKKQAVFMLYAQVYGMAKAGSVIKNQLRSIEKSEKGTRHKGYVDCLYNFCMMRYNSRNYQLAYGLIRNIPYSKIEPKVGPNNKPKAQAILDVFIDVMGKYGLEHYGITLDSIKAWLNAT